MKDESLKDVATVNLHFVDGLMVGSVGQRRKEKRVAASARRPTVHSGLSSRRLSRPPPRFI